MKFRKVLFSGLAILFLALTFSLFPGDIVRKEVRVFGTFEDFVQNKPLKVYQNEMEYDSDKGIKSNQGFIKVIEEKTVDGRTIGTGFLIPPAYYDKYLRLNEFGFKEAGSTKKMVATYDSLDNLFRRRALKTYKSEQCETNSYNDTILVFKHKPNLILVTYYYNQNSSHIYQSVYHMPKALLGGYLQKMVSIGAIKPNQAKQLKMQEDEHITLKFDFQNKYLDGAREQAIEDKYNRQVLTSTTSTSTLTESTLVKSYYIHRDAQGSTTAVTDQDGKLIERVTYGIYGAPTFWDYTQDPDNPVERSRSVIGNTILFQGRRYDYETGLYYFRNRYYDPIMGRFLSTDPLGYKDSMNLYQAFNNNPVNFTDPMGEVISSNTLNYWGNSEDAYNYIRYNYGLYLSTGYTPSTAYRKLVENGLVTDTGSASDQVFALKLTLTQGLDVFDVNPEQLGRDVGAGSANGFINFFMSLAKGSQLRHRANTTGIVNESDVLALKYLNETNEKITDKVCDITGGRKGSLGHFIGEVYVPTILGGFISAEIELAIQTSQTEKIFPFLGTEPYPQLINVNTLFKPGEYAEESIVARSSSQKFTEAERTLINNIGEKTGCHTCGTKIPGTKSGNFIPDHQPVSALNANRTLQRLYPQCLKCSRAQGLATARTLRSIRK